MKWLFAALLILALPADIASAETTDSPATIASTDIETVGFYNVTGFGVGGMVIIEPKPIVLFRNGDALRQMDGLNDPGGLVAHKVAHPKDWTHWRRNGAQIEIEGARGWEPLAYTKLMGPLPRGQRLSGTYQRLSGGGNSATGGGTMIAAWAGFTFDEAGQFTAEGGAGGTSKFEGPSGSTQVTTSTNSGPKRGRYEIDGYRLVLSYDDGRVERRLIVTDLADPKSAVWIDGNGYVRR